MNPSLIMIVVIEYRASVVMEFLVKKLNFFQTAIGQLLSRNKSKLYISSTLNIDLILWHTQLIVCAVKYQIMVEIMGYFFHFSSLYPAPYIELYVC